MASEYTRTVSGFSGIGGGEVYDAENLLRVFYRSGDEPPLSTVPGYREIEKCVGAVNGIFRYGMLSVANTAVELLIVHAGDRLYAYSSLGECLARATVQIENAIGTAFRFGEYLYLLDGKRYYRISASVGEDGKVVLAAEEVEGYIPTVASEGEPYETQNLYSKSFYEKRTIVDPRRYAVGSEGLVYSVTSEPDGEAALISGAAASGEVLIPATVNIGEKNYRVTAVGEGAFRMNSRITSVILGSEVTKIESRAFLACTALTRLVTNGKLTTVGAYAFSRCHALREVSFSEGLSSIEKGAFNECNVLTVIRYGGASFTGQVSIDPSGNDSLLTFAAVNHAELESVEPREILCPLTEPSLYLESVHFGGVRLSYDDSAAIYYRAVIEDGYVTGIRLHATDPAALYGKQLVAELSESKSGMGAVHPSYTGAVKDIILGCRVAAVYDGRIFLTGNDALPGTVFYSGRTAAGEPDPGYFGIYNYFRDGEAGGEAVGLCSTPSALYVFTSETAGCGIYRHTGSDTGDDRVPRVYPNGGGHYASGEYRASILYRDEVLLLSSRGVSAIGRDAVYGTTVLEARDEGFPETVGCSESARLGSWLGYLAVIDRDRILLGDGRRVHRTPSGGRRYEWWRLSDIVGYEADAPVYRYATELPSGVASDVSLAPSELGGAVAEGEIISLGAYFAERKDGRIWLVRSTGERTGGTQYPIRAVLMRGDDCYFGCENGALYRFSTDKMGLPPSSALGEYGEAALKAFAAENPDYIAPEWYSFAGHPIRSRLVTALDDCGHPTQLKSTLPKSTVLECGSAAPYRVDALTSDGRSSGSGEIVSGSLDFAWLVFGGMAFVDGARAPTVFRENTKKWHQKQYAITANGVESPIEIRRIGYLYTNVGKVRN